MNEPFSLGVLISGGGTTLRNLLQIQQRGELSAEVRVVISSNPHAGGMAFSRDASIPTHIVKRSSVSCAEEFRDKIFGICREASVDLVVMAGFLKHVLIPDDFVNRVVNIHPSLIPAFCGKGYYGLRVHRAVLDYGAKITGCTVHFVDNQYDHGPIILQRPVEVLDADTPETLAERVLAEERQAYPETIRLLAAKRVTVHGRRVIVDST